MTHPQLSTHSYLKSALGQVMSLCINRYPRQEGDFLIKVESNPSLWEYAEIFRSLFDSITI